MTASSYDGRKPEPPYHTDSDVVVNLQEQIDALTEERDELRTELQRLQSSPAPDGQPILAEAFADNGAHSHWYLIDPKTGAKVWSEDPEECAARGFAVSSTAPELSCESCVSRETCPRRGTVCMYHDDGIPESSPAPVAREVLTEEDLYNACEWTGGTGDFGEYPELIRGATVENLNRILASRLSSIKPGEVVVSQSYIAALENAANQFCAACIMVGTEDCPRGLHACGKGCSIWRLDAPRINALRSQATNSEGGAE